MKHSNTMGWATLCKNPSDQTVKLDTGHDTILKIQNFPFFQRLVSGLLGVDGLLVWRPVDMVLYKEPGL